MPRRGSGKRTKTTALGPQSEDQQSDSSSHQSGVDSSSNKDDNNSSSSSSSSSSKSSARKYASKDYWEARYKRKVTGQGEEARSGATKKTRTASVTSAAEPVPQGKRSKAPRSIVAGAGAGAGAGAEKKGAACGPVVESAFQAEETDEWFFNYDNVKFLLHEHCVGPRGKQAISVLDVGCGNSPFLIHMAKDGWQGSLYACDFARMALRAFEQKCKDMRVATAWCPTKHAISAESALAPAERAENVIRLLQCDCRSLASGFSCPGSQFDLIIDKGTMDAMLSEPDEDARFSGVRQYFSQVADLLKVGGSFVLMSHMGLEGATAGARNWLQECLLPALLHEERRSERDADSTDSAEGNGSAVRPQPIGAKWSVDIHSAGPTGSGDSTAGNDDGEKDDDEEQEGDEEEGEEGPSVWIIRKNPRGPITRASPDLFLLGDVRQHLH